METPERIKEEMDKLIESRKILVERMGLVQKQIDQTDDILSSYRRLLSAHEHNESLHNA